MFYGLSFDSSFFFFERKEEIGCAHIYAPNIVKYNAASLGESIQ